MGADTMPMHDWTKVPDGIFHAFHHGWITAIGNELNAGRLPADYYALPEQVAAKFLADVLTLKGSVADELGGSSEEAGSGSVALRSPPQTRFVAETEAGFYRRKKSSIVVRHVSGDRIVAMLEIVSPGNKSSQRAFKAFLDKAWELLDRRIHLMIVDPFPPGPRDPNGVHAAIWEEVEGEHVDLPPDEPLTLVSYQCDVTTRAYIEPFAVGQLLPDMPLYIESNEHVMTPLEETYNTAFTAMPARWRKVLVS